LRDFNKYMTFLTSFESFAGFPCIGNAHGSERLSSSANIGRSENVGTTIGCPSALIALPALRPITDAVHEDLKALEFDHEPQGSASIVFAALTRAREVGRAMPTGPMMTGMTRDSR
jgi:hypothetical protein